MLEKSGIGRFLHGLFFVFILRLRAPTAMKDAIITAARAYGTNLAKLVVAPTLTAKTVEYVMPLEDKFALTVKS
jgi:hypothetical protein